MTDPTPGDHVHYVTPDGTCQDAVIIRTNHQLALLETPHAQPIAGPDPQRTPGTWHPNTRHTEPEHTPNADTMTTDRGGNTQ